MLRKHWLTSLSGFLRAIKDYQSRERLIRRSEIVVSNAISSYFQD